MDKKNSPIIKIFIVIVLSIIVLYFIINKNNKNSTSNKNNTFEKDSNISNNTNKPTIELKGLVSNSEGNYVTNVDLNSEFNNNDYKATSKDGIDLTDKVIINIMFDNRAVEKVDTSKLGIYYINYTVVDDNGNSSTITRNVIIKDISAPVIEFPTENNSISKEDTTFDLMNGISCSDNSGNCDITTKGTIDFGVVGRYIIEYIAKDSSGNTSTKKRVIRVE